MRRILGLVAFTLLLAPGAHAETSLSTSSFTATGTQDVWCNLTNLGSKPVTVLMEHVDIDGNVVNTASIEIFPGASDSASMDGAGLVRCRFTGKFSRKAVRAAALVIEGGTLLSVPAN